MNQAVDGVPEEEEQAGFGYYELLRQSLNRVALYQIDKQYIQDFITNQRGVVRVLRRLARHRLLDSDTHAGRQIRELRTTILQEVEVMEIAFSHLDSAYRAIEPRKRFIEGVINPDLANSGTATQRNAALRMLREFDTHYAVVNGQWDALLRHTPEVRYFTEMDLS